MSLEPRLDAVQGPCTVRHVALVRLTVVHDEAEAEVVCGLLRANDIECSYRKTDVAAGAWTGGFARGGPIELLVNEGDLVAARGLLPES
jgi:hypothetical protein